MHHSSCRNCRLPKAQSAIIRWHTPIEIYLKCKLLQPRYQCFEQSLVLKYATAQRHDVQPGLLACPQASRCKQLGDRAMKTACDLRHRHTMLQVLDDGTDKWRDIQSSWLPFKNSKGVDLVTGLGQHF